MMDEILLQELELLTEKINDIKKQIWDISIEPNKVTNKRFCEIMYKIIQEEDIPHSEAYTKTEVWHIEQFGCRRYKTYKSFKVVKSRRRKR
jgi:hypothetical protein